MAKSKKKPADHENTERDQDQSTNSSIITNNNDATKLDRHANTQNAANTESPDSDESPINTRPKGMDA